MFKLYVFPIIMYIIATALVLTVNVVLAVAVSVVFFGAFAVVVGSFTGSYTASLDFIMFCVRLVVIGVSFVTFLTSWARFPSYLNKYHSELSKQGAK